VRKVIAVKWSDLNKELLALIENYNRNTEYMANQRPPEPPPSPNNKPTDPNGKKPTIGPDGKPLKQGPNWKVMIFMLCGVVILYAAFNSATGAGKPDELNFSQFRALLQENKLTLKDDLTFSSGEGSFTGKFTGKYDAADYRDTSKKPELKAFNVVLDTNAHLTNCSLTMT